MKEETMSDPNPFQEHRSQEEEPENQPALRLPRVDRQRDMGTGLNAATAPGTDPEQLLQNEAGPRVGPGADPHAGTSDGSGFTTGQYRGSDEGTTTGPVAGAGTGDSEETDLDD
jgi:hypothetical protein